MQAILSVYFSHEWIAFNTSIKTGTCNDMEIIEHSIACMALTHLSAPCQLCFRPSIVWPACLSEHSTLLAIVSTLFAYAWEFFHPHWRNHHQNIFNFVLDMYIYPPPPLTPTYGILFAYIINLTQALKWLYHLSSNLSEVSIMYLL